MNSTQIKNINKMNRASASPVLGQIIQDLITSASATTGTLAVAAAAQTAIAGASAYHSVTASEASASRVVLTTGLASVTGFVKTGLRSGADIGLNWTSGSVAGTIVVVSGVSASPLENDKLNYIAW
jgi:hypothetical protein